MRFGSTSVRAWAKEWRTSPWRETIPLASGRECPECFATVCGGQSWRAHEAWHGAQLEWRLRVNSAVRKLAAAAGMTEIRRPDDEDEDQAAAPRGVVIGSGPLPEEMRGGGE